MIDNQTWQFIVATVIGLLTLVLPLITLVQRQKKELAYDVIYHGPALKIDPLAKSIQLPNSPLYNAHIVVLELRNSGTISVHENDYTKPIQFVFDTKILNVSIEDSKPIAIKGMHQGLVRIDKTEKAVLVDPLLLNSQEWIKIVVLLTQFSGVDSIHILARIVGVSEILRLDKLREKHSKRQRIIQKWFECILVVLSIAIFFAMLFSLFRYHNFNVIYIYILIFITVAFLMEYVVRNIPFRR